MHNAPISLTYVGDQDHISNSRPRPLTTTKRFFLQLLRAHLHSITQSQTSISTLLKTITSVWNIALSVAEAVRLLEQVCLTDEMILSDERIAIDAFIILADLKTKVRARFVVEANMACDNLVTATRVEARVVYGERYDENKMSEFLSQFTGSSIGSVEEMSRWAEGVEDLKGRLLKRGKKGERV
jgi:kinetochore protein Spc7/SPC105